MSIENSGSHLNDLHFNLLMPCGSHLEASPSWPGCRTWRRCRRTERLGAAWRSALRTGPWFPPSHTHSSEPLPHSHSCSSHSKTTYEHGKGIWFIYTVAFYDTNCLFFFFYSSDTDGCCGLWVVEFGNSFMDPRCYGHSLGTMSHRYFMVHSLVTIFVMLSYAVSCQSMSAITKQNTWLMNMMKVDISLRDILTLCWIYHKSIAKLKQISSSVFYCSKSSPAFAWFQNFIKQFKRDWCCAHWRPFPQF